MHDSCFSFSGLYLHYRNLFVHVVETDEDSITKHLKLLYADPDVGYLYDIKLLGDLCHINNRLISFWATYVGKLIIITKCTFLHLCK